MRRSLVLMMTLFVLMGLLTPAFAQDVTMVPFTDHDLGISGLVPEGWTKVQAGIFVRGANAVDLTLLLYGSNPGTMDEVVPEVLPSLGIAELPEPVGTLETDAFAWTLYQIEVETVSGDVVVDWALNESNGAVNMVILQTTPQDYDALHEQVFLPAIEALTIAEPLTEVELPYIAEEVTFPNGDITLAGTLTLPEAQGQHPAVILISGSGPQDRDESLLPIAEIKPFALIADHLTRNGIAVLRYDDRGVGESTGDFSTASSFDFAADAEAAIAYLLTRPDINPDQIGVLGHSEGGLISAIIGARNPHIAFIISMAGTAVSGREILELQTRLIMEASGVSEEEIEQQMALMQPILDATESEDEEALREALTTLITYSFEQLTEEERSVIPDAEAYIALVVEQQLASYRYWMGDFLNYNPGEDWAKITVPVLALFGGKDLQVDAEQNAVPLEAALQAAGNADFLIVTFPNANHLFQEAGTGAVEEYATLEQTFTPDFLPTITDWLLERVTVVQ